MPKKPKFEINDFSDSKTISYYRDLEVPTNRIKCYEDRFNKQKIEKITINLINLIKSYHKDCNKYQRTNKIDDAIKRFYKKNRNEEIIKSKFFDITNIAIKEVYGSLIDICVDYNYGTLKCNEEKFVSQMKKYNLIEKYNFLFQETDILEIISYANIVANGILLYSLENPNLIKETKERDIVCYLNEYYCKKIEKSYKIKNSFLRNEIFKIALKRGLENLKVVEFRGINKSDMKLLVDKAIYSLEKLYFEYRRELFID
ncbi:MAG: hypothetical protein V1824_01340 [archaeon]